MDLTEPHEELVGHMGPNGEAKLVRGYIVSLTPVLLLEDKQHLFGLVLRRFKKG